MEQSKAWQRGEGCVPCGRVSKAGQRLRSKTEGRVREEETEGICGVGYPQTPLTLPEHLRGADCLLRAFSVLAHIPPAPHIILILPLRKLGRREIKEQTEATQPGRGGSRVRCARLCAVLVPVP